MTRVAAVTLLAITVMAQSRVVSPALDEATAGRFAALALACVQKEYPNKIAHVLNSPEDVKAPHELTPSFYGCYDWHSSVHGHWLLARLARQFPSAAWAVKARAALAANINPKNIAGEVAYLNGVGRETFERPYGLAWLLQLAAELREWKTPEGQRVSSAIAPLEAAVVKRLRDWIAKLAYPIREGEHAQTAFAFGLLLDWGRVYDRSLEQLTRDRVLEFHRSDRNCPISYEPSGQDFLSPCLAEADLIRRVLPARRVFHVAHGIPAGDSKGWFDEVVAHRRRHGQDRRQACTSRRAEPQPRLDAGRDRRCASHRRSPACLTSRNGSDARRQRSCRCYGRAL
jgi:hypothetical protein